MVGGLNPCVGEIFHTHPDQCCGPSGRLYNRYQVSFPRVKRPGSGVNHLLPPTTKVREIVVL